MSQAANGPKLPETAEEWRAFLEQHREAFESAGTLAGLLRQVEALARLEQGNVRVGET